MRCPDCGAEMKPLAYSVYCPNDCDRIPEVIDPEKTERIFWNPSYWTVPSTGSSSDADTDGWLDISLDTD